MPCVIVKCRPRGVSGIWNMGLEDARRPSAEWSKFHRHRLVGIIDLKLFSSPISFTPLSS